MWLKMQENYEVLGDLEKRWKVEGADRRSIPSFSMETEKRERASPAARKAKSTGSAALAMRAV
jgi:hypothetical protein